MVGLTLGLSEAALDGAVRDHRAETTALYHHVSVKPRSMARCEWTNSVVGYAVAVSQ